MVDIDEYARLLPIVGTPEMEQQHIHPEIVRRLERLRAVYDNWRQFPNKRTADMVRFMAETFGTGRTQAYEDIQLVKILLGNIESSTKEFWRWRINQITMDSIAEAAKKGNVKVIAALLKILVANNKTDKEDTLQAQFDKIVPQQFEMTDDISIVIPGKRKHTRKEIDDLIRKYGGETTQEPQEPQDPPTPRTGE